MQSATTYMTGLLVTCLLMVLVAFLSCRKFVTVDQPIDRITTEAVFSSDETATAAILGLYSQMMPPTLLFSAGGTTVYAGLYADELYATGTTPNDLEFNASSLQPTNNLVRLNFWLRLYRHIYHANQCIEKLEASAALTPALKDRLAGEARVVRAFCYFYLVNLFGDVPLVTSTAYSENATLPRSPAAEVWDFLQADLESAKALLPETYPSPGAIRPNKWAATALLARVYLYRSQWARAEAEATAIIRSGRYSLPANLSLVFGTTSPEAIWQLAPVEVGFNTNEPRFFVPTTSASSRPQYALSNDLVAAFDTGDARKRSWIGEKTAGGQRYYYPFKYKIRDIGLPVTEHNTLLRYAEVWLIRAEARARQEKPAEARADLDTIRSRAGLPPVVAPAVPDVLAAIAHERRLELFAEWGHRWFDLKRTGRAAAVLSPLKPAWQSHALLWAIPQGEILQNPALTQNPGYR